MTADLRTQAAAMWARAQARAEANDPTPWDESDEEHAARAANSVDPETGRPDFACAECERRVHTEWEVVMCTCTDDPTCDPCCDEYHDRSSA